MIQFESDSRAIARAIADLAEGEIIGHGTARAIAAGYNEPGIVESFVSTGAMPGDLSFPVEELMSALTWQGRLAAQGTDDDRTALDALSAYLHDRNEGEEYGPVPGWSDMWVAKHVDYPHWTAALHGCCAEDEDEEA